VTATGAVVTALRVSQSIDVFPESIDWAHAPSIRFNHDWQGRNPDTERETRVGVLWNEESVFVAMLCQYRSITVFQDADPNGRRDELWERDVAEVFLQPDRFGEKYYKEFEVSPNGQWLDLDITPAGLRHITSGIRTRVAIDDVTAAWRAQLAIPLESITDHFDPAQSWRVNFFRCEGSEPDRFYSAWQPTETEKPNFHVPEKFGWLRFEA
jgi:alpha-galactosidase